MVSKYGRIY